MNRRLMSSLVSVSLLGLFAGTAAAQPKTIPGAPKVNVDAALRALERTDYGVWAEGDARTSRRTTRIEQGFIAHTSQLTQVEVNVTGAASLNAKVINESGAQVGAATMTISGDTAIARFEPRIILNPGEFYTVRITSSNEATFYLAKNDESYVFSEAFALKSGGLDDLNADLNMRVRGTAAIRQAAPAPTKRALLILLENGGVTLSGVKELKDAQPKITYYSCGSCKFELKKNESFQELMGRVAQSLGNCMECIDPKKWHEETVPLDSWMKEFSDFALEEVAKAIDLATIGTAKCKYDKIVKCEDGQFTAEHVLAALDGLDNYIVDVHVLSHGGPDSIVGYNNARLTPTNFFRKIEQRRARGESINLRAIYQMNCFSGSLAAEWLAVGANVVNGTKPDKLNMMPPQYFGFLKHWMNGEQFDSSVQKGYDEVKWFFDILYAQNPQNVTDSQMYIHGDRNLRFK